MEQEHIANIRHSLAHLLAAAVLELYPNVHITIGPATDNGFYYDIDTGDISIADQDLPKIEKKMKELLSSWKSFDHKELSADDAKKFFDGNIYKLELIEEISKTGEPITLYTSGNFTDLCRGGHAEHPDAINPNSFKLDKVAGAYWRGDENNKMLTRIYGLAFATSEELAAFEKMRNEAAERDHRKIGKEMDLFTISPLVGGGLPLFTPKGTAMREAITDKIGRIQSKLGFERVTIPHITKPDLYKTSGHWEKFGEELFKVRGRDTDFVMKPMNCPHHTQIFASSSRSYKELPIRYAENTMVYRDEQSGELLGLSRVRSITQDDGHVFCRPDQIKTEIKNIIHVMKEFYTALDMWKEGGFTVLLSARDPKNKEKYIGEDSIWENSEKTLAEIAEEEGLPYTKDEGGAAFYGPKLDFNFKDAIGRKWQLATVQLDFNMPMRFGLTYTDDKGAKATPVMIHRAIAGSLERFLSVIIEHFAGNFPIWLAPVQISLLPVNESHIAKAQEILEQLRDLGIRADIDTSDNGLGKKVRKAKEQRVPLFAVLGDKELESGMLKIEHRGDITLEIGEVAADKLAATLIPFCM